VIGTLAIYFLESYYLTKSLWAFNSLKFKIYKFYKAKVNVAAAYARWLLVLTSLLSLVLMVGTVLQLKRLVKQFNIQGEQTALRVPMVCFHIMLILA
jgi:hypothetical protein